MVSVHGVQTAVDAGSVAADASDQVCVLDSCNLDAKLGCAAAAVEAALSSAPLLSLVLWKRGKAGLQEVTRDRILDPGVPTIYFFDP